MSLFYVLKKETSIIKADGAIYNYQANHMEGYATITCNDPTKCFFLYTFGKLGIQISYHLNQPNKKITISVYNETKIDAILVPLTDKHQLFIPEGHNIRLIYPSKLPSPLHLVTSQGLHLCSLAFENNYACVLNANCQRLTAEGMFLHLDRRIGYSADEMSLYLNGLCEDLSRFPVSNNQTILIPFRKVDYNILQQKEKLLRTLAPNDLQIKCPNGNFGTIKALWGRVFASELIKDSIDCVYSVETMQLLENMCRGYSSSEMETMEFINACAYYTLPQPPDIQNWIQRLGLKAEDLVCSPNYILREMAWKELAATKDNDWRLAASKEYPTEFMNFLLERLKDKPI